MTHSDFIHGLSEIYLLKFFGIRVGVATICGLIIGWERELKNKVAGIRTNVLVCVGACILTAVSFLVCDYYDSDPTRIIGQIITGVGFLGGGVIFKIGDRVTGVTTASFIWVMCAIGVLAGVGFILLPIVLTFGLLGVSIIFKLLENRIFKYKHRDDETHDNG